jgi:hypothetical protein
LRAIWNEVVRESRWVRSSHAITAIVTIGVAFAGWSLVAGITQAQSLSAQFSATLDSYRRLGPSIDEALEAPAGVSVGADGIETIENPLRYDLDAALAAFGRLGPAGQAMDAMSLAVLVLFPVCGFVLGVVLATHDRRSGSIAVRWPRTTPWSIASAKVLALSGLLAMLALVVAVASAAGGAFVLTSRDAIVGTLPVGVDVRGVGTTDVLAPIIGVASGTSFGLLGLAIASATQERTVTISTFSLVYFLAPIVSALDPRNALPLIGTGILQFTGSLRPEPLGSSSPAVGALTLAVLAGVALVGVYAAWARRLPARS